MIMNSLAIKAKFVLFFLMLHAIVLAQDSTKVNEYGLWIISTPKAYIKYIAANKNLQLVAIQKYIPTIKIKLYYATNNNFTKTTLYPTATKAYISKQAAIQLQKVQLKLAQDGLGLVIYDAYRPYSVTKKMWQIIPDDRYAANPKYGSAHNRGIAVDVSLIELKSGNTLEMGTAFDHFSDTAHHSFTALPNKILHNRKLLKNTMEQFGFTALATEWWHYSLPKAKNDALFDIDFKQLKN